MLYLGVTLVNRLQVLCQWRVENRFWIIETLHRFGVIATRARTSCSVSRMGCQSWSVGKGTGEAFRNMTGIGATYFHDITSSSTKRLCSLLLSLTFGSLIPGIAMRLIFRS